MRRALHWAVAWPSLFASYGCQGATTTVVACAADGACPAGRHCVNQICEAGSPADTQQTASSDSSGNSDSTSGSDGAKVVDIVTGLCDPDPTGGPSARGDLAGGLVGGKLVVLYGDEGAPVQCQPAPKYATDAHAFNPCKGWEKLDTATLPPARARASSAYDRDNDALFYFGGRFRAGSSGPYTNYGDLWRFAGQTGQSTQLHDGKTGGPTARSNSAIGYRRQTQEVYAFGGNTSSSGLNYAPQNDTWVFDVSGAKWSKVATTGTPPLARLFHAGAVSDDGKFLVIFSGGGADALTGSFYPDTWALDLDTLKWKEITGKGPKARIKAGLAPAPNSPFIWMFGGHDDGAVGNRNDLWSLDPVAGKWVLRFGGDLGSDGTPDTFNAKANAFCDFPPDFMQIDKKSPERREGAIFSADKDGNLWLFGGKSDCGALRDVWKYNIVSTLWENLDDTSTGWSCDRYKKPCNTLCN